MPRLKRAKTPEQIRQLELKEQRRQVRAARTRIEEDQAKRWELEREDRKRQLFQLLNGPSLGHAKTCKLCRGPIDAEKDDDLIKPFSYRNQWTLNMQVGGRDSDVALHALRWLPQLCHPCMTRNPTKLELAKSLTGRVRTRTVDQRGETEITSDRRHDLFLLLLRVVVDEYGYFRYGNRFHSRYVANPPPNPPGVIGPATKGAAEYWVPSAVYRRMRKRLGIKGRVCAWLCDRDPREPNPHNFDLHKKLGHSGVDLLRRREIKGIEPEPSLATRLIKFKGEKRERERIARETRERKQISAMPHEIRRLRRRVAELEGRVPSKEELNENLPTAIYWVSVNWQKRHVLSVEHWFAKYEHATTMCNYRPMTDLASFKTEEEAFAEARKLKGEWQ